MASPPPEAFPIRRAAVIGAGTMGAAIAAHLANAGVPTLLLDVPGPEGDRNAVVRAGLERCRQARPPAFMDPEAAVGLLTLGNTADDLARAAQADWIVEAIVEQPAAKQALWAEVERQCGPGTIFSSNSSGIPMHVQSAGRGASFRRRFLGAHFYNPPRYLHLLELIPTADTSADVLETIRTFGDRVLGKGIVLANDVPGFIGNRIGIYALLQTIRVMEEMALAPALVDALTGPMLGRPKSGTLRLADTVGLDVLGLISADLLAATEDDFRLPEIIRRLLERGARGEKSGAGFYRRIKNAEGASTILTLDPITLEYAEQAASLPPEVAGIAKLRAPAERIGALLDLDAPAGEFTRRTFYEMMRFAGEKLGVVANTPQEIDHAMEWGFGWEAGPFRLCDALGAERIARGIEALGAEAPRIFREHVRTEERFYAPDAAEQGEGDLIVLSKIAQRAHALVRTAEGANLIDLGDGALLLEVHNKANSIGPGVFELVATALELVPGGFAGLVIGNQGRWFSAGADLGALLRDAAARDMDAVRRMIEGFQRMTTSLRAAPFPVVAAPFGMTLGGGCEMMLYSDAVQADAELATGLVELKVGLMPSAGGTTEMLARSLGTAPDDDPFTAAQRVFDLITAGRVSASAHEARRLGFLRASDAITLNSRRVLGDAKTHLLSLVAAGYAPPEPRSLAVTGGPGYARLMEMAEERRSAGQWTEYDVHLAGALARILTGGGPDAAPGQAPERVLLELEREVFIALCAEPNTHARIRHMLATGKPLRN